MACTRARCAPAAPAPAATTDLGAPAWDLHGLYAGPDDPRLDADLDAAARRADAFAARWRGAVAPGTLAAAALAAALGELEEIEVLGRRPGFYASLLFAADTGDPAADRLAQRTRERWTEIDNRLVFFRIELTQIPDDAYARLAAAPELADLVHHLDGIRRRRPHTLSEPEEQIIGRKNLAGRDAFVRLFEELTASFRFRLVVDGVERELSGGEVLALLYQPDRALRERAYTAFLERFAEHGLVLTAIFNSLVLDHRLECEVRRFPTLAEPTHLDNEVTAATVEAMMDATERHYGLARRYFACKARLLGVERLAITDLYAPLGGENRRLGFAETRALVLDAFRGFSPVFHDLAAEFFERGWIDAAVRPGKQLGAFCAAYAPAGNPFILTSYAGTMRDVTTVAHELGHGIHDRLAARQRYCNYTPPLPLAETASVFAELVLIRHLLARETRPAVRRQLLCTRIEESIATVFRQNVLTRFELAAHEARREGPLTAATLGELWWRENARLYGRSAEMIPPYRWGWSYIPHFIHSRFYCYAYVFGELVVLGLYERYLAEGDAFVPRYLELLTAGGSAAPDRLLARVGIDIADPGFWARSFRVIEALLGELEALP
jgi:oligoendopeptidase F